MAKEIERRFLVTGEGWREGARGVMLRQGFLSAVKERVVRVRVAGEEATLTIKGIARGLSRAEFEYAIPMDDADYLLNHLCLRPFIEKRRHTVVAAGMVWVVDEFYGENDGLVMAEVELEREDQPVELPPWVGKEVSHDPRYQNSSLSQHPYRLWKDEG